MTNLLISAFYLLALTMTTSLMLIDAQTPDRGNNYLDVEPPSFFQYNSPLQRPESLRSPQYFDFLSTLYHRDATKADLFRPYQRSRRAAVDGDAPLKVHLDVSPVAADDSVAIAAPLDKRRSRRAIVFRPLFVYRQQQIRKQQVASNKRRRV